MGSRNQESKESVQEENRKEGRDHPAGELQEREVIYIHVIDITDMFSTAVFTSNILFTRVRPESSFNLWIRFAIFSKSENLFQ